MATATQLPKLEDHAEYARERAKLTTLLRDQAETEKRISDIDRRKSGATSGIEDAARALLASLDGDADEPAPLGAAELAQLTMKRDDLVQRLRVLRTAVEQQERVLQAAESRAKRELSLQLLPEYRAKVGEALTKMVEAAELHQALWGFTEDCYYAGVLSVGVLQPVGVKGLLGSPTDRQSRIHNVVAHAAENGLIAYDHPAALACGITPPRPRPEPVPAAPAASTRKRVSALSEADAAEWTPGR